MHFWKRNYALSIQRGALAMLVSVYTLVEPVLALAPVVIVIGLLCFALNLWKHTVR